MIQNYFPVLTLFLMIAMMVTRVNILKKRGIEAMNFDKLDKTDFIIPPFALFYFYLIIGVAFHLPTVSTQVFFHSEGLTWSGVVICLVGLVVFLGSLISFGQSFRVGIDVENPDQLITTGAFAFSRNPIFLDIQPDLKV